MAIEIDHLGIAVASVDDALGFYADALGMSVSGRDTVDAEDVNVAMLRAGTEADAPRIELLEASSKNSTVARFLDKRGPGLHHIALRVDDLRATAERLANSGARVLGEPQQGAGGHKYVFVHPASTGGVLLELIQK